MIVRMDNQVIARGTCAAQQLPLYWIVKRDVVKRDVETMPFSQEPAMFADTYRKSSNLWGAKSARRQISLVLALLLLMPLAMMLLVSLSFSGYPDSVDARPEADWSLVLPLIGLVMPAFLIMRSTTSRHWSHWLLLDASIALIPLLALLGGML